MPNRLPEDNLNGREGANSEKISQSDKRPETVPPEEASQNGEAGKDSTPSDVPTSNKPRKRADRGRLHAIGHGVLARYPLEALQKLGEDVRKFRRLESKFRQALKPDGEVALLLFDRFWSSYLRCVLAARVEAQVIAPRVNTDDSNKALPQLHERDVPTLLFAEKSDPGAISQTLPTDLIHELTLLQRYECHFSRELYRSLHLLLIMREGGEDGLTQLLRNISKHTIT
jgi:hypothetical protein